MPRVEVPPRYRGPTNGVGVVEVEGPTVRACIEAVDAQYPGFGALIFEKDGSMRRFVSVFVNGELLDRNAADKPVAESDRIQILAAAAGG